MRWVDVQNSFGGSNPIGINEYYRNSTYVPSSNLNSNIPTSGQIEATDFRGADGFSGTTGSFIGGSSGGKIPVYGYNEGQYGSNVGTAFTTNSGIKCNFHLITGFVGFIIGWSTLAPSNLSNNSNNQLCYKVCTVTSSASGAILSSPQTFLSTSNPNRNTPTSFGGGTNSTNNSTPGPGTGNPPFGVFGAAIVGQVATVSIS